MIVTCVKPSVLWNVFIQIPLYLKFLVSGSFVFTFSLYGMKTSGAVFSTHSGSRSTLAFTSVSKFFSIFLVDFYFVFTLSSLKIYTDSLSSFLHRFNFKYIVVLLWVCYPCYVIKIHVLDSLILLMNSNTTVYFLLSCFACWLVDFTQF